MDINEIDAASHNSVDDIRRLTDEIVFTPIRARYKVYIIDEVHMLSPGAFNALLKTLEEPPAHAVFIMATTEPHRIPATIISRSQHFRFRRIPNEEIIRRMQDIAKSIDLTVDEDALEVIALLSGGALRDAISLLDQTRQLQTKSVSRDDVLALAGRVPDQFLSETAVAILCQQSETLLSNIQELAMSGRDLTRFVTDLGGYFRNLLVCSVSANPERLIQMRGEDIRYMTTIAKTTSPGILSDLIAGLAGLLVTLRFSPDLRTTLEIGLIQLSTQWGRAHPNANEQSLPVEKMKLGSIVEIKDPLPVELTDTATPTVIANDHAIDPTPAEDEEPIPVPDELIPPEVKVDKIPTETQVSPPEIVVSVAQSTQDVEGELTKTPCALPGAGMIKTNDGEESLLTVWRDVLDLVQKEHRIDISLCARPARVLFEEDVFEIHFDHSLIGQHTCLNKKESIELITQLLTQRTGRHYPVQIVLDESLDKAIGATAEWPWLAQARDKALKEDIPSPDERA